MNHRTFIGCLSWLTPENIDDKLERYKESLRSHAGLVSSCDFAVINNGCDPILAHQMIYDLVPFAAQRHLSKNYYEVAVHLFSYTIAKQYGYQYFVYSYDDFVWYNTSFILDAESFMDSHPDVWCMRLPAYSIAERQKYDVATTPKSVNPDSVRHDVGAGGAPLLHGPLERVGEHQFSVTNWRPNSRPTLWRTSAFDRIMSPLLPNKVPVMQPFEAHMYSVADLYQKNGWGYQSAFLEGGACRTYPQHTSQRLRSPTDWTTVYVNYDELCTELM